MSTAAAVPVVRPLPAWLRQRYVIAAAAALVVGPTLWLVRNFISDRVFYSQTRTLASEQAYQAYIKAGWLNVGDARRELPRVALDQAKRKRTAVALRDFLTRYPNSAVEVDARAALDTFYRTVLQGERPSGVVEPLPVDELLVILGRADHSKVNAASLAGFLPAKPTGPDCGKEWRDRLPGEVTPTKGLLARALLRGSCEGFLQGLVGKDRPLLALYRADVEKELGTPASSTALALRQMRDYGTVKGNAGLFSPALGTQMLGAIRGSAWFPETVPDTNEIETIKRTLSKDTALTQAVLDYMQQHTASWTAPAGNLTKDDRFRTHMSRLLDFSRQVGDLGRPALAAQIAKPAQAAFRAEIDGVAKKGTDEMVRFLTSGNANPLAGDLVDNLAAAGKTLLGYSSVGDDSLASTIQSRLASTAGNRILVIPCAGAACDRISRRVKVRVSESSNHFCYDKFFYGVGPCSNRGKEITVTLTYYKDGQALGTDSVSAATPEVVRYRTFGGFDTGPSSSDVDSATREAMNARLTGTKLKLPF